MLTAQEKEQLKHTIKTNAHEIYIVSIEEMDAIVRSSPASNRATVKVAWEKIRDKAQAGASYYASGDDLVTLTKLVSDLGGFGAKAYVKNYNGKPHIILKGYPGLRKVLTGTKYGMNNPKVITMGLGKAGAINAAKSGGLISIVLLSAYRVADYFLTDEATLSQLIGSLATDVVKVGITTAASVAAATIAGGLTVAVGPIVAVILVGVGVSLALQALDEQYGITDRVIAGIDEIGNDIQSYVNNRKQAIKDSALEAVDSVIDYAIESAQRTIVNLVNDYLRNLLRPIPGLN